MPLSNAHTVLGSDAAPKIQFYHEIVSAKKEKREADAFGPLHTQEYYEFSFFINGRRKIKVHDVVYNFKDGDIFLVAPDESHGGEQIHETLDRYRLHIWPDAFEGLPDSTGIMQLFDRTKFTLHKISLNESQMKTVCHYLSNIDNSIQIGPPTTKRIAALADIIKLLVFLNDIIYNNAETVAPKNKLLLDILAYIESSYDTVGIEDIQKHFGISRATLWRLFHNEMDTSPYAYIMEIKLRNAKLMLEGDASIQTISDQCGFCNCSYFIRAFKKKYGATPFRSRQH